MKRLLIVTTIPVTLRAFLLPFARHFRSLGWRVDAMARGIAACERCRAAFDQVHEAPWSRSPLDVRNLTRAPGVVRQVVQSGRYDLVHVHTPVAAFVTRWALRAAAGEHRPKVIYTAHGFHFHQGAPRLTSAAYKALERTAGQWTDQLVVINQEDFEAASRLRIVAPEALHFMPGIGVDTSAWSPRATTAEQIARVRAELGLGTSDRLFTMLAEFNRGKRHADAVSALARLARADVHLALAGIGPLMEQVQSQAARLGIGRQVHLLGFRDDVPALVRASTATLLPSEREGLPRSVMESLSLGVPVIGAMTRGTRDLLSDGSGLLHAVGDVQGLAAALCRMLDNPQEAQSMGQCGRKTMAAYDIRRIIELHESLYAKALMPRRTSPTREGGRPHGFFPRSRAGLK